MAPCGRLSLAVRHLIAPRHTFLQTSLRAEDDFFMFASFIQRKVWEIVQPSIQGPPEHRDRRVITSHVISSATHHACFASTSSAPCSRLGRQSLARDAGTGRTPVAAAPLPHAAPVAQAATLRGTLHAYPALPHMPADGHGRCLPAEPGRLACRISRRRDGRRDMPADHTPAAADSEVTVTPSSSGAVTASATVFGPRIGATLLTETMAGTRRSC